MAGRQGVALKKAVALSAATAKTVLQLIAATNHAIKINEVSADFDGASNTAVPVLLELVRQTSAGTMTSLTPAKNDSGSSDTFDTTAAHSASAEPTDAGDGSEIIRAWTCHPQTGRLVQVSELANVVVPAGTRMGLRVTAPATVNVTAYMVFEE